MQNLINELQHVTSRHEEVLERHAEWMTEIRVSLSRIEAAIANAKGPGDSTFCRTHLDAITAMNSKLKEIEIDFNTRLRELEKQTWAWAGGIALAIVLLTLFGPIIRQAFHLPNGQQNHSGWYQPGIGDNR